MGQKWHVTPVGQQVWGRKISLHYRVLLILQPQKKNRFFQDKAEPRLCDSGNVFMDDWSFPALLHPALAWSSAEAFLQHPAVSLSIAGNSDQTFLSILPRSLSPCEAVAGMRTPKAMLFGGWKEINSKGTFQLCEISICHEHREWEF